MATTLRAALGLAIAGLLATACGDATRDATVEDGGTPQEAFASAVGDTFASTGRFEAEITTSYPEYTVDLGGTTSTQSMTGEFSGYDLRTTVAIDVDVEDELVSEVMTPFGATEMEVLFVDDAIYMSGPILEDGQWFRLPEFGDMGSPPLPGLTSMANIATHVEISGTGQEEMDGVETTRYDGTGDVEAFEELMGRPAAFDFGTFGQSGEDQARRERIRTYAEDHTTFDFTAWVDSDGMLVRLRAELQQDSSEYPECAHLTGEHSVIDTRFSDIGGDVTIEPPSPDDLVDEGEFGGMFMPDFDDVTPTTEVEGPANDESFPMLDGFFDGNFAEEAFSDESFEAAIDGLAGGVDEETRARLRAKFDEMAADFEALEAQPGELTPEQQSAIFDALFEFVGELLAVGDENRENGESSLPDPRELPDLEDLNDLDFGNMSGWPMSFEGCPE